MRAGRRRFIVSGPTRRDARNVVVVVAVPGHRWPTESRRFEGTSARRDGSWARRGMRPGAPTSGLAWAMDEGRLYSAGPRGMASQPRAAPPAAECGAYLDRWAVGGAAAEARRPRPALCSRPRSCSCQRRCSIGLRGRSRTGPRRCCWRRHRQSRCSCPGTPTRGWPDGMPGGGGSQRGARPFQSEFAVARGVLRCPRRGRVHSTLVV